MVKMQMVEKTAASSKNAASQENVDSEKQKWTNEDIGEKTDTGKSAHGEAWKQNLLKKERAKKRAREMGLPFLFSNSPRMFPPFSKPRFAHITQNLERLD